MDPATIAAAAASIIGKIGELNERSASREWQSGVIAKINQMIAQNAEIILLLKDLFVFVPEQLETFFNREAVIRSRELMRQFDLYIASRPMNVRGIREMRDEVERAAFGLLERGPSIYQAANAAALSTLAVYKLAGNVTRGEKQAFVNQVVDRMNQWLGNDPGMFGDALKKQQQINSDNRTALSQIPRGRVELHSTQGSEEIGGPDMPRSIRVTIRLYTNIQIDDINLTYVPLTPDIDATGSSLSIREDVVREKIGAMASRIETTLNAIRKAQTNKATLDGHIASLTNMIAHLRTA